MNEFYYSILSRKEKQRVENLEVFDEYEEWHLKCAHYFVLCASQGSIQPPIDDVIPFPGEGLPLDAVSKIKIYPLLFPS